MRHTQTKDLPAGNEDLQALLDSFYEKGKGKDVAKVLWATFTAALVSDQANAWSGLQRSNYSFTVKQVYEFLIENEKFSLVNDSLPIETPDVLQFHIDYFYESAGATRLVQDLWIIFSVSLCTEEVKLFELEDISQNRLIFERVTDLIMNLEKFKTIVKSILWNKN